MCDVRPEGASGPRTQPPAFGASFAGRRRVKSSGGACSACSACSPGACTRRRRGDGTVRREGHVSETGRHGTRVFTQTHRHRDRQRETHTCTQTNSGRQCQAVVCVCVSVCVQEHSEVFSDR